MQLEISSFRSKRPQPLRDVPIHSPCIMHVDQGVKQLVWENRTIAVDKSNLLIVPPRQTLTFVNTPAQGQYLARIVSFSGQLPPHITEQLFAATAQKAPSQPYNYNRPLADISPEVSHIWNTLITASEQNLDEQLLLHYSYGLLLMLSKSIDLSAIFLNRSDSIIDKVLQQFRWSPSHDWKISDVAQRMAMSESTLRRKLSQQQTSFRELLLEFRLCYGLGLLQKQHLSLTDIGAMCGYLSYDRFARQFTGRFGLSPNAYRKTNQ
ncbi:helix-turn-helix transcriptional regulator [Motiliproteus sp. MSK22-1]|uniref:helix-turn-helix transcriptional regulator n=1 Tax=Motiliproteus sp. MSK22-1 TaxID=1897630 RepID=UPI0009784337|nr:AraC family transcriptional regulator [Motiliproteus sp. MSK22-1]OMH38890.1 hypothetical protein BGP75_00490 [Motiliproteus sp. MSK22-1]